MHGILSKSIPSRSYIIKVPSCLYTNSLGGSSIEDHVHVTIEAHKRSVTHGTMNPDKGIKMYV